MPADPDRDGRAVRTRDLDEAIDAVTKVYCPHTIEVMGRARGIDALLNVRYSTFQPLVGLSYSTPVKIDAQNMSRLFLMMHCASGAASTTQEHRTGDWKTGQTMPFSANFDTKLRFDRAFMQKSVRLDMNRLEAQCARWLGYPLVERLRFDLRPFSDQLEQIWQRALAYGKEVLLANLFRSQGCETFPALSRRKLDSDSPLHRLVAVHRHAGNGPIAQVIPLV